MFSQPAAARSLMTAASNLGIEPAEVDIRDAFATTSSTNDDEEWLASEDDSGGAATCTSDYATTEDDT